MLYAELIQQPAGEMPHHGLKGRIPRVKGRSERHDDGTSLRNRLHILEMDKVQWRLASHNDQGAALLERYVRRAVYQIAARPAGDGRQRTQSVFGNFSFYSYKKACGQKKTVRGSKNSRRLSNGTPAI